MHSLQVLASTILITLLTNQPFVAGDLITSTIVATPGAVLTFEGTTITVPGAAAVQTGWGTTFSVTDTSTYTSAVNGSVSTASGSSRSLGIV
ncbi:hypothetical protein SAICODRAFT_31065 [Saitoella complicata NRRL Y-17804]|nr:uncharacterized protein SAICODRAFT_31065 [Saitoella complicata NRRL Y-17804]ODQ51687.1 hypothetical protein SAICODRAFT_31065 [Saitoella complicata NRRL Y-17804]